MTRSLLYRADIDGLRALAVIAVIINHLPGEYLPSGFLGVDVFFVISGFVISGSLLGQDQAKFSHFYSYFFSRRVKRLLPALFACIGITSFVVLLLDPYPEQSILTGISALFGVSNIALFNLEMDYFAASSKFNAFTHTWSLGVEEQFYIIFPMILWVAFVGTKDRSTGRLAGILSTICFVSLASFLWFYDQNEAAAYFLTPMRMWELGIGALVYLASLGSGPAVLRHEVFKRVTMFASPLTLIALILCFFTPTNEAALATPAAVILTAVLLISPQPSLTSRLFSLPPIVYVGRISYSLYLWHWPVLSLGPFMLSPGWRYSVVYILLMAVASILSYHLLEKPLRQIAWARSKGREITIGLVCNFALALAVFFTLTTSEDTNTSADASTYPPAFLPLIPSGKTYNPFCVVDGISRHLTSETFQLCTVPAKIGSEMPTIWVQGDSHAGHLQGLLYELYDELGIGVHLIETPGRHFPASTGIEYPQRKMIYDQILENMNEGDIMLLSRLYILDQDGFVPRPDVEQWIDQVSKLATELAKKKVSLVVFGPSPIFQFEDIRACDPLDMQSCTQKRTELSEVIDPILRKLEPLEQTHDNVVIFNTFEQLCPPTDDYCYPGEKGIFLFRNSGHLNALGAQQLAKPLVTHLRSSNILEHQ